MKVQNRMPETDGRLDRSLLEDGWSPMREPKSVMTATFFSIPLMLLNLIITIGVIQAFSPFTLEEFGFSNDSIQITLNLLVVLWVLLLIVIHELLHLVFVPNFIKSDKTYIGLTYFGGYVLTEESIAKSRYLLITVAPFVILSILLPITLGLLGILTPLLKVLILINAMASSVDILNLILLLTQVPKAAVLKNNGTRTYWKLAS